MYDLLITGCEHEGNQNAVYLRASVSRETGMLVLKQFDKDAIELTREQALELQAFIIRKYDMVSTNKEIHGS